MEVQPVLQNPDQFAPQNQVTQTTCQFCGSAVGPDSNFCPVCGKLLKEQPLSLGRKIYIYAISLFLPPLGLIWTIKYFRKSDEYKKVGIIAGVLTIISSVITLWLSFGIFSSVQQQINQYSNLGV